MKVYDVISDCVKFLHYIRHQINLKHGGSCLDSPDWVQKPKNNNKPYHLC